jgi:hypothetical protein
LLPKVEADVVVDPAGACGLKLGSNRAWRDGLSAPPVGADVDVAPAACWSEGAALAGAAMVKAVLPIAAKPRTPAMVLEAAKCLMVLMVLIICGAFRISSRAS